MASYKPRQYNFKYPKPLVESSSNNNNNRLLSPRRPQPSPSKRQLMMQELGLDDIGNVSSESSESIEFSDDDITETIGGPTQAEYDALQKDRDNLLVKNKELRDGLQHCNGQLHREETKRQRHVKILKKAQNDLLKDKDQLIMNLEDIIFDGEQKIKQLEENLKGNPIKPTMESQPQVSSIHKLVDTIKSLHNEKSVMREELMNLEQEVEENSTELSNLRENQSLSTEMLMRENSRTDNEKVVEKLKIEIQELLDVLKGRENELVSERENSESTLDKLNKLEKKKRKLEDEKKKNEKKAWSEIEALRKELEMKTEKIYELGNKPPEVVTKTAEKVVELESSEQKAEIGDARNRIYELEKHLREREQISKKSKDEILRLREQINKYQSELSKFQLEVEDSNSAHLDEEEKLQNKLRQKEADLNSERKNFEKMKKNMNKEKEIVSSLEQELQELKASSKRARDETMVEIESLKRKMQQQEADLNRELKEANDTIVSQKLEAEESIERLKSKILKTEEKFHKAKEMNQELNGKVIEKSAKLEGLSDNLERKEDLINSLQTKMINLESDLEKKKSEITEFVRKLIAANSSNEALQSHVKDLSGATDVATVELSGLKKENSTLKIELNQVKSVAKDNVESLKKSEVREEKLKEQLRNLDLELVSERKEHQTKIMNLEETHSASMSNVKSSASAELHAINSKLYKLQCSLRHVLSTLHIIKKENQHLKKECSKFSYLIEEATMQAEKNINEAIAEINDNSKELIRRYKKEMKLRKKYHNELVELKGNIRVFGRVRPAISEDGNGDEVKNVVTYDHDDDGMIYVHNSQRGRSTLYELDKIFQPESTQNEVYSEVQALVTSCIDGYHVCIFAYGQTGSGKTYTMEGPPSDPGINQRALSDLFREIEDKSKDWEYEISVSLVEIYNETLKDLLNSKPAAGKLGIKMNVDGGLYVPGLLSTTVQNLDEVNSLFATGRRNRATACTNMNEHSSRSHAVLIVNVKGKNETTGVQTFGKLNLIDLAGSERVSKSGASGDRLKEAQNINKSLSALGDVIQALGAKQAHVPFRNSKLTYLLQDSLSKDSKTLMVVQVAPVEKNVSETICSLSFAQRVRKVELGQAGKKIEDGKQDETFSTPKKTGIPTSKTSQQMKKKF